MINEALKLIRVFHDLRQFELAEHLKVSKSHISEIESGTKTPSLELMEKYSAEFRIPDFGDHVLCGRVAHRKARRKSSNEDRF